MRELQPKVLSPLAQSHAYSSTPKIPTPLGLYLMKNLYTFLAIWREGTINFNTLVSSFTCCWLICPSLPIISDKYDTAYVSWYESVNRIFKSSVISGESSGNRLWRNDVIRKYLPIFVINLLSNLWSKSRYFYSRIPWTACTAQRIFVT